MKIAAICPIGYLDQHGYQYTYRECIASQASFADRLYVVDSVGGQYYGDLPMGTYVVAGPNTRFEKGVFDAHKVMENCNHGADIAAEEGFDIAIALFCNWYVPEYAIDPLRVRCELMLTKNQRCQWLFRKDQLAGQMFSVSTRLPFILNLHDENRFRYGLDSVSDGTHTTKWQRQNLPRWDCCSVVDVQLEMPLEDLAAKQNFVRCYHDLLPKRNPVFNPHYWLPYYATKFKAKVQTGEALSATGKLIAEKNRPEFVSNRILEKL